MEQENAGNATQLMTVSCPECAEKLFSFSRNVLVIEGSIQFLCTNCGSVVKVCYTEPEHEVFVQCL